MATVAQDSEAQKERTVKGRSRGFVPISAETILNSVAKEQLVSEDLLVSIEDRLPR